MDLATTTTIIIFLLELNLYGIVYNLNLIEHIEMYIPYFKNYT